jgi:exoribonuclease II
VRQLLIWGVDFVEEFLFNAEITNEKVSMTMLGFGIFMIALGFRKHEQKR